MSLVKMSCTYITICLIIDRSHGSVANYFQVYVFFFFQAEEGIRDYKVTGVQTCALPISAELPPRSRWIQPASVRAALERYPAAEAMGATSLMDRRLRRFNYTAAAVSPDNGEEIGRASCRERV